MGTTLTQRQAVDFEKEHTKSLLALDWKRTTTLTDVFEAKKAQRVLQISQSSVGGIVVVTLKMTKNGTTMFELSSSAFWSVYASIRNKVVTEESGPDLEGAVEALEKFYS